MSHEIVEADRRPETQVARVEPVLLDAVNAGSQGEGICILAAAANEHIDTGAAIEHVFAIFAIEEVAARTSAQQVVSSAAIEDVISRSTVERVGTGSPDAPVVDGTAVDRERPQRVEEVLVGHHAAVGKAVFTHRSEQPVTDGEHVAAVPVCDREVGRAIVPDIGANRQARNSDANAKLYDVGASTVLDGVHAVADRQDVFVVARTTGEEVVADPAHQLVVASVPEQCVVAVLAREHVRRRVPRESVRPGVADRIDRIGSHERQRLEVCAEHRREVCDERVEARSYDLADEVRRVDGIDVVACASAQCVDPGAADKHVVAVAAFEKIFTRAADQAVLAAQSAQGVVACVSLEQVADRCPDQRRVRGENLVHQRGMRHGGTIGELEGRVQRLELG